MAILKNCEIYFLRANPKYPNKRFNPDRPTWECQIRTTSKEVKAQWAALGLPVKGVVPDTDEPPYFRVHLKKRTLKADGSAAEPVRVVDGHLNSIAPDSVGNGSIGNIRIFQYAYKTPDGKTGVTAVLMDVQITKLVKMKPRVQEDEFEMAEMEVIEVTEDGPGSPAVSDDDGDF